MGDCILKWTNIQVVKDAISAVRSDRIPTDWLIITYQSATGPGAQILQLSQIGVGGIDEMAAHLKDNMVGYCLVRQTDVVDESHTIKFVFVFWVGEETGRMQKSRTSIHIGPIKQFIGQYHLEQHATLKSELTSEIINRKVMDTSGSGSRVLDSEGKAIVSKQAVGGRKAPSTPLPHGHSKMDQVQVLDADKMQELIKQFRIGSQNDWIAFTYTNSNSNVITFLGMGSGAVEEFSTHLKDDNVVYGLIRKIDRIDESDTVKLCFVCWVGEHVNPMFRGRIGTHKGVITKFLSPYHVDISVSNQSDLSDSIILDLITSASGSKSHVLADGLTVHTTPVAHQTSKCLPNPSPHVTDPDAKVTNTSSRLKTKNSPFPKSLVDSGIIPLSFEDEDAIRQALASVRSDASNVNWALISYTMPTKSKTIKLIGTGTAGVSELLDYLKDDMVGYALIRLNEVIDQSETTKFVFVKWVGDDVNRLQSVLLSTHKGFIVQLLSPFHVDHECNQKSEINEDILMAKIKKAAGTANYVLN